MPDIVEFDATEASVAERLYPNQFGLFMFLTHGAPVTTTGDGVITDPDAATIPSGCYRHVWTSGTTNTAPRSAQATIGYTDQTVYARIKGLTCSELAWSADGAVVSFAANMMGLYPARITNPSLTPTYDAATIKPFIRSHQTIQTWLTSSGATTNATSLSYTLANPVESVKTLSGSKYPDNYDRTGKDLVLSGELRLRDLDADDIDSFLLNFGSQFTIKTKWNHTQVAAGGYTYKMWVQGNAGYQDMTPDEVMHRVRNGMTLPFTCGYDATLTYGYKVTLVNTVSSYSSVG